MLLLLRSQLFCCWSFPHHLPFWPLSSWLAFWPFFQYVGYRRSRQDQPWHGFWCSFFGSGFFGHFFLCRSLFGLRLFGGRLCRWRIVRFGGIINSGDGICCAISALTVVLLSPSAFLRRFRGLWWLLHQNFGQPICRGGVRDQHAVSMLALDRGVAGVSGASGGI